jgi:hypothetical protein
MIKTLSKSLLRQQKLTSRLPAIVSNTRFNSNYSQRDSRHANFNNSRATSSSNIAGRVLFCATTLMVAKAVTVGDNDTNESMVGDVENDDEDQQFEVRCEMHAKNNAVTLTIDT